MLVGGTSQTRLNHDVENNWILYLAFGSLKDWVKHIVSAIKSPAKCFFRFTTRQE
jgi:hypothetical protein